MPGGVSSKVLTGADIADIQKGLDAARATSGQPTVLVARTLKGKGLAAIEGGLPRTAGGERIGQRQG